MFRLDNVTKHYGGTTALLQVSADLPTDRAVFIVGPSGSGKSTLLRLLALVEAPDAGEVTLELAGCRFTSQGQARPWPRLTCVFQRQFLWPHLTLRQNIILPLQSSRTVEAFQRAQALIEEFEMEGFADRHPNEVSGGQAQRAAIVRALALQPEVILIDEAHGGLDLDQQARLNDHLARLRERQVGLIVVTHSLEFARQYADTILVLEDGCLVESGSRKILDDPKSAFLRRVGR